jgi:hypothetical protein
MAQRIRYEPVRARRRRRRRRRSDRQSRREKKGREMSKTKGDR